MMYKELYNNELSRRDKLNAEINIPITLVTLLFGSVAYIAGSLVNETRGFLIFVTLFLLVVLVVSLVLATMFIIKSFYNYVYEYIAHAKQMEDYYNSLVEHYKNEKKAEKKAENDFEAYLVIDYCKCNERNTLNNDKRSSYLHNAKTAIVVALIACAISIGTSNYNKVINTADSYINKVFNGKEVEQQDGQETKSTGAESQVTTATAPTTPN